LFLELYNNLRESLYNCKLKKIVLTIKICNNLTIANCRKSIIKFSLYNIDKVNSNIYKKRIYYNCNKKKYI